MPHPSLTIYKEEANAFLNTDFRLEHLSSDCRFTEGPVWNKQGYYLFSDIPANCIYQISEAGNKKVFLQQSGTDQPDDPLINNDQPGSNGLAYTWEGELLICQHGGHGVARLENGKAVPYITSFKNRSFNSPNDIIVTADGTVYFSDPPYGLKGGKLNADDFQDGARVYSWREGRMEIVSEKYQYPNGVCLSPDGQFLYICSNKPFEKFISLHQAATGKFIRIVADENSDGIKCDPHGNLYLSNKAGLLILNPEGERMALISLPTIPANHCWGGSGLKDLLVTARENVFLVRGLLK